MVGAQAQVQGAARCGFCGGAGFAAQVQELRGNGDAGPPEWNTEFGGKAYFILLGIDARRVRTAIARERLNLTAQADPGSDRNDDVEAATHLAAIGAGAAGRKALRLHGAITLQQDVRLSSGCRTGPDQATEECSSCCALVH